MCDTTYAIRLINQPEALIGGNIPTGPGATARWTATPLADAWSQNSSDVRIQIQNTCRSFSAPDAKQLDRTLLEYDFDSLNPKEGKEANQSILTNCQFFLQRLTQPFRWTQKPKFNFSFLVSLYDRLTPLNVYMGCSDKTDKTKEIYKKLQNLDSNGRTNKKACASALARLCTLSQNGYGAYLWSA